MTTDSKNKLVKQLIGVPIPKGNRPISLMERPILENIELKQKQREIVKKKE